MDAFVSRTSVEATHGVHGVATPEDFCAGHAMQLPCTIVGAHFAAAPTTAVHNALLRTPVIGKGTRVFTTRQEPDNTADPHAVQVLGAGAVPVGYLTKHLASALAPLWKLGLKAGVTVQGDDVYTPLEIPRAAQVVLCLPEMATQRHWWPYKVRHYKDPHLTDAKVATRKRRRAEWKAQALARTASVAEAATEVSSLLCSPKPTAGHCVLEQAPEKNLASRVGCCTGILATLFSHIRFDARDLAAARAVCKTWRDVIDSPNVAPWKKTWYKMQIPQAVSSKGWASNTDQHLLTGPVPVGFLDGCKWIALHWADPDVFVAGNPLARDTMLEDVAAAANIEPHSMRSWASEHGIDHVLPIVGFLLAVAQDTSQAVCVFLRHASWIFKGGHRAGAEFLVCLHTLWSVSAQQHRPQHPVHMCDRPVHRHESNTESSSCTGPEPCAGRVYDGHSVALFTALRTAQEYTEWPGFYALELNARIAANTVTQTPDPHAKKGTLAAAWAPKLEPDQTMWTSEQASLVGLRLPEQGIIQVSARAGTGKTACLVGLAKANPHHRILYLAFNKSVEQAAAERFPKNVKCMTAHGFAFRAAGAVYQDKLTADISAAAVAAALGTLPKNMAGVVAKLKHWLCDDTEYLEDTQRPAEDGSPERLAMDPETVLPLAEDFWTAQEHFDDSVARRYVTDAQRAQLIWGMMCTRKEDTPNRRRMRPMRMTHNGYLKLWAMRGVSLHSGYDLVMVDEAQDLAAVMFHVIDRTAQRVPVVMVGDTYQNIYRFMGTQNIMQRMTGHPAIVRKLSLQRTFRFGFNIAAVANAVLAWSSNRYVSVIPDTNRHSTVHIGCHQRRSPHYPLEPEVVSARRCGKGRGILPALSQGLNTLTPRPWQLAFIGRTNFDILEAAMSCVDWWKSRQLKGRIGWDDDLRPPDAVTQLLALAAFSSTDEAASSMWKLVNTFSSPEALARHIIATDTERSGFVATGLAKFAKGKSVVELIQSAQALLAATRSNATPDIVFTTAHKAKGLEYDEVIVGGSWSNTAATHQCACGRPSPEDDQELNLLYVAVTRARSALWVVGSAADLISAMPGVPRYGPSRRAISSTYCKCHVCGRDIRCIDNCQCVTCVCVGTMS